MKDPNGIFDLLVEKLQYKDDCESVGAVQPSDIYGSAHLLRLMVKIGGYLSFSNYSEPSCKVRFSSLSNTKHRFIFSGDRGTY